MINCWPGSIGTGPKPAVLSSVSILSWVALNITCFGWSEKLVSVSSVLTWWNSPGPSAPSHAISPLGSVGFPEKAVILRVIEPSDPMF